VKFDLPPDFSPRYFASIHNPKADLTFKGKTDFSFESDSKLTLEELKGMIVEYVAVYRIF
jgi:hypothetical protein